MSEGETDGGFVVKAEDLDVYALGFRILLCEISQSPFDGGWCVLGFLEIFYIVFLTILLVDLCFFIHGHNKSHTVQTNSSSSFLCFVQL